MDGLIPWEWIFVDGNFLVLRNPLVRALIGVSDAARGRPRVGHPVHVLLIGDPQHGEPSALPGALVEVHAIAKIYSGRPDIIHYLMTGPEASFENVAEKLSSGRYDVVHFAGHAWFDDLEPYLLLSQLVKLRASEMRSLLSSHPPAILFLNSHFTTFVPPGASGERPNSLSTEKNIPALQGQHGFIEAASTAGVGTLIGTFCGSLDDTIAQQVGVNFHKELLGGTPVAQALHQALLTSAPKRRTENPSHLSYTMSGYGDITFAQTESSIINRATV